MVRLNELMRKIARKSAKRYEQAVRVNAEQDDYEYLVSFDEWCERNGVAPWKEKNMFDKMLGDKKMNYQPFENYLENYKRAALMEM